MSYEAVKLAALEAQKGMEQVREAVRLGFEMKRDLEAKRKRWEEERENRCENGVDVIASAILAERERCAKIAYEYERQLSNYGEPSTAGIAKQYYEGGVGDASIGIAAAIRQGDEERDG